VFVHDSANLLGPCLSSLRKPQQLLTNSVTSLTSLSRSKHQSSSFSSPKSKVNPWLLFDTLTVFRKCTTHSALTLARLLYSQWHASERIVRR